MDWIFIDVCIPKINQRSYIYFDWTALYYNTECTLYMCEYVLLFYRYIFLKYARFSFSHHSFRSFSAKRSTSFRFDSMGAHKYTHTHIISIDASVKYPIFCCYYFVRILNGLYGEAWNMQLDYRYMFFFSFGKRNNNNKKRIHQLSSHIKNPNAITDGENGLYRKFFSIFFLHFIIVHGLFWCAHMSVNYMERHEFYSCARSMRLITKIVLKYINALSYLRVCICSFAQRNHA